MSNASPPPRPPRGEAETQVPEGQRDRKQAQLTPETPAQGVAPEEPAKAPPPPQPEPPSQGTAHENEPEPKPLPASAQQQLPEAKYGKGDPVNPPPETVKR
ncbi:hypothetical protein [Teichococcus rhizosphaerae]|nr:hypothetical protein [Pseudoroseomonas rhizosphaerae]